MAAGFVPMTRMSVERYAGSSRVFLRNGHPSTVTGNPRAGRAHIDVIGNPAIALHGVLGYETRTDVLRSGTSPSLVNKRRHACHS